MHLNNKNTEALLELEKKTGRNVDEIANEILAIHLDNEKKNEFISQVIDNLFLLYKMKKTKEAEASR